MTSEAGAVLLGATDGQLRLIERFALLHRSPDGRSGRALGAEIEPDLGWPERYGARDDGPGPGAALLAL
jgi:hypothetical protein